MTKSWQIWIAKLAASICAVVAALCVLIPTAHAQSPSQVSGVVKDQQGASISGAQVALIPSHQSAVQTTTTDAAGLFSFQSVPAGTYEVKIEHSGFAGHRLPITVTPRNLVEVNVVLEVSAIKDVVTVTAETGQAQDKHLVAQQVNIVNEQAIVQRATAVLAQVAEEEVGVSMQRTSPTIGSVAAKIRDQQQLRLEFSFPQRKIRHRTYRVYHRLCRHDCAADIDTSTRRGWSVSWQRTHRNSERKRSGICLAFNVSRPGSIELYRYADEGFGIRD